MGPRLRIVGSNWGQIEPLHWTLACFWFLKNWAPLMSFSYFFVWTMEYVSKLMSWGRHPGSNLVPGPHREVWVRCSALGRKGLLFTQTKSHDHENMRALKINYPKAVLWRMEILFCNWWVFERRGKWKWTMARDCNICSGSSPHYGDI